jgi:hypothetical protein
VNAPHFSLLWITWPIGLLLLASIAWQSRKQNQKPIEKPNRKTKEEKNKDLIDKIARRNFPERFERKVSIHSAIWRAAEGKPFDVTEIAKAHIVDGRFEMRCTTEVLGDPHEGLGKVLAVDYFFEGKNFNKLFAEGRIARLP